MARQGTWILKTIGRLQKAFQLSEIMGMMMVDVWIFLGKVLIAFIRFSSFKELTFEGLTGHNDNMYQYMIRTKRVVQKIRFSYFRR